LGSLENAVYVNAQLTLQLQPIPLEIGARLLSGFVEASAGVGGHEADGGTAMTRRKGEITCTV
jgi:hypothetical protein